MSRSLQMLAFGSHFDWRAGATTFAGTSSFGPSSIELWDPTMVAPRRPEPMLASLIRGWVLQDGLHELTRDPFQHRALMELVARVTWSPAPSDHHALLRLVVELVDRGWLAVGFISERLPLVPLIDARESPGRPVEPTGPTNPVRPLVEPRQEITFIEVGVREHPRYAVDMDYVLSIDGARRSGHFHDESVVREEPLAPTASCSITLEHIPVPGHAPRPRPSVARPGSGSTTPAEVDSRAIVLVVVADDGSAVPAAGCQVLCEQEALHDGAYPGAPLRFDDVDLAARYSVTLDGIRLPLGALDR